MISWFFGQFDGQSRRTPWQAIRPRSAASGCDLVSGGVTSVAASSGWVWHAGAPDVWGDVSGSLLVGVGLGGQVGAGSARSRARAAGRFRWSGRSRRIRLLMTATGLTVLFVPSATATFDYRYSLPCLVVLPIATGLTTTLGRKSYHLVTEVTGRVRETS